ncbi:MAG: hypothetical protein H3C68_07615 [Deltaproteobacteria bacterium]|nr:hypothetical protein [Deltaproteobacteria bacterium]MBZ0220584.1 hypothetical protein [Deltaproteobacteria bacterium]
MPRENAKKEDGSLFLDLAGACQERFAVKPVTCDVAGPAAGRAIFINSVRYSRVNVNGAPHITGVLNGKIEEMLLVSRTG